MRHLKDLYQEFQSHDREYWKSIGLIVLGSFIMLLVFFRFILYVLALIFGLFLVNKGLRMLGRPPLSWYAVKLFEGLKDLFS